MVKQKNTPKQPYNFRSMWYEGILDRTMFKTLLCLTQLRSVGGIGLITHSVYYLAISGALLIILRTSHTYCRVMVWWCII